MKFAGGAPDQARPRRLLLALDANRCEPAAIDSAIAIAAKLEAELEALFLEDIDMLAVAELPFTHEVCSRTACTREISPPRLERVLRTLTRAAEERIAMLAGPRGRFRVVRAKRAVVLGEAVDAFDLLLLPAAPPGRGAGLAPAEARVFALVDGSPAGERTLQLAQLLARRDHGLLEIACRGGIDAGWLRGAGAAGLRVHARSLPEDAGIGELLAGVSNRAGNVLLVAAGLLAGGARSAVLDALAGLRCQVLVVN